MIDTKETWERDRIKMGFISGIIMCTILGWIVLMVFMLPVYFVRKKRNPLDPKNTIKTLVITALVASVLFIATISVGLLRMYLDEIT